MIFLSVRYLRLSSDFGSFIVHGSSFSTQTENPKFPIMDEGGYDGQFYARFALNPFNIEESAHGVRVDRPAYRYQRILYPLTAFVLSFGSEDLVPFSLVLVNALSLIFIFFITRKLLIKIDVPEWYALVLAFLPGLLMSLGRDLAEPLALALGLGSFYAVKNARLFTYAVLSSLCVLSRETSIILFAMIGLSYLTLYKVSDRKIIFFIIPGFIFIIWQLILTKIFGAPGFLTGPKNFGVPFGGMIAYLDSIPTRSIKEIAVQSLYQVWIFALLWIGLRSSQIGSKDLLQRSLSFIFILWSILAVFFTDMIWEDDWSFCRVLLDWQMAVFVLCLSKNRALPKWLSLLTMLLILGTILRLFIKV